jgi:hypothetical protein
VETIAVEGEPRVGTPLEVRASADIAGDIDQLAWQRCIRAPGCLTIDGADGAHFTPTEAEGWHVLRIITVVEGRAIETRVGPVVDTDPERLNETFEVDPTRTVGVGTIVARGATRVRVSAPCNVTVIAGVLTPTTDESSTVSTIAEDGATPARTHDLQVESEGGQLTVSVLGDCDTADVHVTGQQ